MFGIFAGPPHPLKNCTPSRANNNRRRLICIVKIRATSRIRVKTFDSLSHHVKTPSFGTVVAKTNQRPNRIRPPYNVTTPLMCRRRHTLPCRVRQSHQNCEHPTVAFVEVHRRRYPMKICHVCSSSSSRLLFRNGREFWRKKCVNSTVVHSKYSIKNHRPTIRPHQEVVRFRRRLISDINNAPRRS